MIEQPLRRVGRRFKRRALDFVFKALMRQDRGGRAPFGFEELKLLHEALLSQNLCSIDGTMVPTLEREFALAYGVPYAVASTSGTAAIHVALGALDLNPGDEVITAPITDLGTIIPILYQNAIPVFADVDDTYNMDPAEVESRISRHTRAIIVVHLFGNPCDMDAMRDIAQRHRLPLIEDCSQAHMARYKGQLVGTIGDIGTFSFQQSKQMTTGDGGITITSNPEYFERMKLFVDKGYARKGWGPRAYYFHAPNYRMTELTAAVGIAQLRKVRSVVERRQSLGAYMTEILKKVPAASPAPVTPGAEHGYWVYPIRVPERLTERIAQELRRANLWALPGYTGKPIYLCSDSLSAKRTYGTSEWPFTIREAEKIYEYREGLCPRAERILQDLVCLVWNESWTRSDAERAASILSGCLESAGTLPAPPRQDSAPAARGRQKARRAELLKVKIGIVGCGQMGRLHLEAYKAHPDVELVAFADTNQDSADRFAAEVGRKAYRSHVDMLSAETLSGVSVCSVPSTHKPIVMDLLGGGVHVLCEKPLATSGADAATMCSKAEERQRVLLTAFKFRFHDEVRETKKLIQKGTLGRIANFRLVFGAFAEMAGSWYAQRNVSGGGVVIDNGSHAVDLIQHLLGDISTVFAEASARRRLEVEDTAHLLCTLQDGTTGTIELSWSVGVPRQAYLEIYGEEGTAFLDLEGLSYRFRTWSDWKRIPNRTAPEVAFARQIDHFVKAIRSGTPSEIDNTAGLKSQLVIDAAYESLRQNRKVAVLTSGTLSRAVGARPTG